MNEKNKKRGFCGILIINYIAILIYNFLTPPMSDDLYWHPGEYASLSEILSDTWWYYNNWLGRVESYFFTRVSDAYPKGFYNFVSSVFFIALILALYFNIEKDEKYDCRSLSLISLYIWIWGVDFAQTILWVCGTCNYLWCLAIEFGFLAYYRHTLKEDSKERSRSRKLLQVAGIFLWGVLAGNGNEGSSGALFLLVAYFTIMDSMSRTDRSEKLMHRIRKGLDAFRISGILGIVIGLVIMVFAPGNSIRGAVSGSEENQTGLLMYLGRFIKINDIVYEYMSLLIIVLVILLVYMHKQKGKTIKDLVNIYAYIVIAATSIYVIILTTIPMPRAFMGGSLILLIACMQLIQYIDKKDRVLDTLATGVAILMAIFMMHSYVK